MTSLLSKQKSYSLYPKSSWEFLKSWMLKKFWMFLFAYIEMTIHLFSFIMWITWVDFWILCQLYSPWIYPTWSSFIILFLYITGFNLPIFLKDFYVCVHDGYRSVVLFCFLLKSVSSFDIKVMSWAVFPLPLFSERVYVELVLKLVY